jgi:hypothetical protein
MLVTPARFDFSILYRTPMMDIGKPFHVIITPSSARVIIFGVDAICSPV